MKDFPDIKKELHSFEVRDPSRESKYGEFLNRLVLKYDLRGSDPRWDLWYFSQNTEFCRNSAERFLQEIRKLYGTFLESESPGISLDELRIRFGCFCFYLYSGLESFAHEANIFYELGMNRGRVGIKKLEKKLPGSSRLETHLMTSLKDPVVVQLLDYRDAIMHGYVFPFSRRENGIFIKAEPKLERFTFKDYMDETLLEFCESSYKKVSDFICKGWRCFEIDELTDPHLEEDVRQK